MKTIRASRVSEAALVGLAFGTMMLAPAGMLYAADAPADEKEKKEAPAKEEAKEEAKDEAKDEGGADKFEASLNYLELGGGGLTLDGNKGAFQARNQVRRNGFAGIENFHYEGSIGKKGTFKADGFAIFGNRDYSLKLDYTHADLGYLRAGMREFRTWYDGSGGFFPPTAAWYGFYDDALALDRGDVWVEGGLTLKKWPTINFKYAHTFREGSKDSTSWGMAHPGPTRGIVPSFWDIDEHRDSFQGDVKHTIGKTTIGAGLRYDTSKDDNARKMRFWPGEAADRRVTQRETVWSDILSAHAFSETKLHKNVFLSTGYSFTTLDTDQAGSRVFGNDYDVAYVPALANGLGFIGLGGGSKLKEHTMNLNVMLNPWETVTVVPSLRLDRTGIDGWSSFSQTGLPGDPTMGGINERDVIDLSEQLEVRYTGLTNWVLYARGEWTQGEGDLTEIGAAGFMPPINRVTEDSRTGQKYTFGANWYACKAATFDFQYYHKQRRNEYDNLADSTPFVPGGINLYPAFVSEHDFDTDDANIRLTLRPIKNVTFVSRYDYQISRVHSLMDPAAALGEAESARINTHVFAESVTWVPWSRLYLQGAFNYVLNKTETPADSYTQAVLDSKNNYWTASLTAGFVVDNKTDLTATYFYYRANNYQDNSLVGVPYGAGAKEHCFTAGLSRRLRTNLQWNLKYGFFNYRDESSGGWNNYDAHLIYSSLHLRF